MHFVVLPWKWKHLKNEFVCCIKRKTDGIICVHWIWVGVTCHVVDYLGNRLKMNSVFVFKISKMISIGASQVAACIGMNPFKTQQQLLVSIWAKYPKLFPNKHAVTEEMHVEQLILKSGLELTDIETHAGNVDQIVLDELVQKKISETNLLFTDDQQKQVSTYIQSKANTIQGTRFEHATAQKAPPGKVWEVDSTFYRKPLCKKGQMSFQLVGKIDRVEIEDGTRTLVEIKNRVKKLFREVRDYEQIQIQCYLQLTGMNKAKLVEEYKKGNEMHTIEIEKNQDMWETVILPKLIEFCEKTLE